MERTDSLSVASYCSRELEEGLPTFLENLNLQACEEFELNDYEQDACSAISAEYISHYAAFKCQRDGLVQVMSMEAATTSCLVLASRRGKILLVSGDSLEAVQPIADYNLPMAQQGVARGKGNVWLCDATLMADASAIVYSVSDRTLHFYDTSCSRRSDAAQEHRHIWKVGGMKNCITSLCYSQGCGANNESTLYLGDEQGNISALTFLQPAVVLFSHKGTETQAGQAETIYWPELFEGQGAHSAYVQAHTEKRVHAESVLQMTYCPLQQIFVSCSLDPRCSVRLRHAERKVQPCTFSTEMGVRCFSLHPQRFEIASGSDDGALSIWNPIIPKRPILTLSGHEAAVVDVLYTQDLLLSICRNAELRIWGVSSSNCLKTIQLKTPLTYRWSGAKNIFLWHRDAILVALDTQLAEVMLGAENSSGRGSLRSARSQDDAGSIPSERNAAAAADGGLASWRPTAQRNDRRLANDDCGENCFASSPAAGIKVPHVPMSAVDVMRLRMKKADEEEGAPGRQTGINERIEKQDRILAKRRHFVEQCAPHLALSLWSPDNIAMPKVPKFFIKDNFEY